MAKIAISVPTRDILHAEFAFDLAILAAYCVGKGHDIKLNHCTGTIIPELRTALVIAAIEQGADWIFWLDSDMRFPKDALEKLLAHDKPIVGTNYVTREIPPSPTARNIKDDKEDMYIENVYTKPESTGLEKVDYMGFGCAVIKTDVFKEIGLPYFNIGFSTLNNKFIGEDVFFCLKAAGKNFPVLIDHDLSKEIKHIGNFEYRHEHIVTEGA